VARAGGGLQENAIAQHNARCIKDLRQSLRAGGVRIMGGCGVEAGFWHWLGRL